ncbi:MAG: isoprenylcysteine carboxylmethyltransferase family protein [Sedimentisphaerales bacterium]|nr:isoprenylcysteine carboxylmethyltransferase family protein [Sedimentisphaerales bacterium]
MWKQIITRIADFRIAATRIMTIFIMLLAIFSTHSFSQNGVIDIVFETSGLFLLTICSVGRLWALLYIGGYKRRELITEGPYSITRNPLYLFSLIGAIGIGLASENLLVLSALVIFYIAYYPITILAEEKKMTETFGQTYLDYMRRTPRFLPRFSLYKRDDQNKINADVFLKNLANGMWFIWIFIALHLIEMLQQGGYIPVFLKVP